MRRWKRIVAILLIAVLAFVIEGWASSAQGAETFFKKCTYTRTEPDGVKPPFSLAPLMGSVKVTAKTSQGSVVLRLDRKLAPCAVHSIVHLSLMGYYTDKTCPGKTAAYVECATASPGYRFAPELSGHESYPRGTVALGNVNGSGARLILVHHGSRLPAKYTVVGRITGGLPAVDRIARAGQPAWITGVQIG
ncbi:peptidylprolyl isomerase [Kribbella koreensis]|uniref:Peptidylprolyl isomerase n=2 Tax=Kribbella TaxID=182639 RepID=A0ABP6YUH4_9ACTN